MLYDRLSGGDRPPVRAGLCGVGEFGYTLLDQARFIQDLELCALCDLDVDRVRATLAELGHEPARVVATESARAARDALGRGAIVVTPDAAVLCDLGLDVLVEATGDPEHGAINALRAIRAGQHVAMVSKEAASVIGPLLAHEAARAGVVFTLVEGDQPSLLVGLIARARALGLEIAAAGKASEFDFVYHPDRARIVTAHGSVPADGFDELWHLPSADPAPVLARRAAVAAALPQRTAPDYCELGLVANCSGLRPDRPDLHAPIARPLEIVDLFRPGGDGGLLEGSGRLDVFNCLRQPDEASFAGGVFVVVRLATRRTAQLFRDKGIAVSADGCYALFYNPIHALGVEAPISILAAARLGAATAGAAMQQVTDLVGVADEDLPAGHVLRLGARHALIGTTPLLVGAAPLGEGAPIPYYLAAGRRLARPVARGQPITCADVGGPGQGTLWNLRLDQDRLLIGAAP